MQEEEPLTETPAQESESPMPSPLIPDRKHMKPELIIADNSHEIVEEKLEKIKQEREDAEAKKRG